MRADFDVEGLHIAAATLKLPRATPWRFDASTYAGGAAGPPLRRRTVPQTPWDPELARAMADRGVDVHEEVLLPRLLGDLEIAAAR